MWIIPKIKELSVYAQGTEALNLDSKEQGLILEQSLMWRSKPSLFLTWCKRCKQVKWMQHLFSQTLSPSDSRTFATRYTDSLADIRANPSAQLDREKGKRTPDICGHTSKKESKISDQTGYFLKMLKDISLKGSYKSSQIWKKWATSLRQDYSQRRKLVLRTEERDCSSWPTISARDVKGCNDLQNTLEKLEEGKKAHLGQLPNFVMIQDHKDGLRDQDKNSSNGKNQGLFKNWATPQAFDAVDLVRSKEKIEQTKREKNAGCKNLREQVHYTDLDCKRSKAWPTARTSDAEGGRIDTEETENGFRSKRKNSEQWFGAKLRDAVETHEESKGAWPTPITADVQFLSEDCLNKRKKQDIPVKLCEKLQREQPTKKLNPRWVEQLMGLEKNWVKPDEDSSNRTDEIRMLGNGVVPQTAEKAFITLLKKLILTKGC